MPEPIRIRLDLEDEEAEKFEAIRRYLGVNASSEVVRNLITRVFKDLSEKGEIKAEHYSHANVRDDSALIVNNWATGDIAMILFRDGGVWCDKDNSDSCTHIEYALTVPAIRDKLREKGWKNANKK